MQNHFYRTSEVTQFFTFNTQVAVSTVRPGLKRLEVTIDYLGPDYFNRTLKMESYAVDFNP